MSVSFLKEDRNKMGMEGMRMGTPSMWEHCNGHATLLNNLTYLSRRVQCHICCAFSLSFLKKVSKYM